MAYQQVGALNMRITNSLKSVAPYGNDGNISGNGLVAPVNYTSVQSLRNALNAANAAYYTFPKLDQMCVNDMIFALRNISDATTIADYMTNKTA